mgnify:FL=1
MNNFPKKRTNPFEKPITAAKEEKIEPVVKAEPKIEEPIEEFVEEPVEIEEYVEPTPVVKKVAPKPVAKSTPKPVRSGSRNQVVYVESEDRLKYTATMDRELRRRIKIVCATREIMFSQFIEQACIEKLNREGDR